MTILIFSSIWYKIPLLLMLTHLFLCSVCLFFWRGSFFLIGFLGSLGIGGHCLPVPLFGTPAIGQMDTDRGLWPVALMEMIQPFNFLSHFCHRFIHLCQGRGELKFFSQRLFSLRSWVFEFEFFWVMPDGLQSTKRRFLDSESLTSTGWEKPEDKKGHKLTLANLTPQCRWRDLVWEKRTKEWSPN